MTKGKRTMAMSSLELIKQKLEQQPKADQQGITVTTEADYDAPSGFIPPFISLDVSNSNNRLVNAMAPALESTRLFVVTILLIRLVLRTSMTIDTSNIIAIRSIMASRHPRYLFQNVLLIL